MDQQFIEKKIIKDELLKQQCTFEEHNFEIENKYERLSVELENLKKADNENKVQISDLQYELLNLIDQNDKLKGELVKEIELKNRQLKTIKDKDDEINQLLNDAVELRNDLKDKELLKNSFIKLKSSSNKLNLCIIDYENEIKAMRSEISFLKKGKKEMIDTVRQMVYPYDHKQGESYQSKSMSIDDMHVMTEDFLTKKNGCPIVGCNGKGHIDVIKKTHRT